MPEYIQGPDRSYPAGALPALGAGDVTLVQLSGTASIALSGSASLGLLVPLEGTASLGLSGSASLGLLVPLEGTATITVSATGTDEAPTSPVFAGTSGLYGYNRRKRATKPEPAPKIDTVDGEFQLIARSGSLLRGAVIPQGSFAFVATTGFAADAVIVSAAGAAGDGDGDVGSDFDCITVAEGLLGTIPVEVEHIFDSVSVIEDSVDGIAVAESCFSADVVFEDDEDVARAIALLRLMVDA